MSRIQVTLTVTAINFTFDRERAFIATDSALSIAGIGSPIGYVSKALAFPVSRLVVACSGSWRCAGAWFHHVLELVDPRGIDDLARRAPDCLRGIWRDNHRQGVAFEAFHFGVTANDQIKVLWYSKADDFAGVELAPNTYLMPMHPFISQAPVADGFGESTTPDKEPPRALTWRERANACIALMRAQHLADPASTAGVVSCTTLTPYGIQQNLLPDLGCVEDASNLRYA
jgi:hypothetical protein